MDEVTAGEIAALSGEDLQRAILTELVELNVRLARAEVAITGVAQGKGAKWLALFAKTSGMGVRG